MSTKFEGTGNLGAAPEVRVFAKPNNGTPSALLKMNMYFDNPVKGEDGRYKKVKPRPQ